MGLLKASDAKKILLLEGIHQGAVDSLTQSGFKVELLKHALAGDELVAKAKDAIGLGIRSKTQVTKEVLEQLPNLQVLGTFCIGTNQVALDTANVLGVPVFNAPYSNTRSVAELVIAEMIALSRRLGDINSLAHQGKWNKSAAGSKEVRGKTLGIIGYGHIGSQVSVLAEAMGLNVLFYDVVKKLPLGNASPSEGLKDILSRSDFVTLHVPETPQTRDMLGAKELKQMKAGSYLINASRGSVVKIPDLVDALKSGHIAGAAIDVFPKEPASNDETFSNELQGLPNVILTPHIGGSTEEAQVAIGLEVSESISRYLLEASSFGSVNFPNLDPPSRKVEGVLRLANVHKNTPGVLGEINSIASEVGANIKAQYLSTDSNIGYVVMDIERGHVEEAGQRISELSTSIKTRML